MRNIITALALSALALGAANPAVAKEKQTGEQKLAELLDGRVAGEPQACISTNRINQLEIIDKTALVYKDGDTLWVNRTAQPDTLDRNFVLVIKRTGMQLCKLDTVTMVEQSSGFYAGSVFLKDFVPYKKSAADK